MIHFEHVEASYPSGPSVLQDLNFDLPQGSFHFLTGASGAGKSTLLKLMYFAMKPSKGKVRIFNKDIDKLSRFRIPYLRRRVGVVFQDFRLLDHLTAFENVALPMRVSGKDEKEIKDHVTELMHWVGLDDHFHSYPAILSGGEKQRLAIARAIINKPDILLADEPTGNVDDKIALRLLHLFEELNRFGTTVIIATHNDALVSYFKKPVLHIENKSIVRQ